MKFLVVIKLPEDSYAIGEQPRTVSVTRITRIDREGFDVGPVVQVVTTLTASDQQ